WRGVRGVSAATPQRALITGISGQDGSYLAELLRDEGIELHGIVRARADGDSPNLDAVRGSLTLHESDLLERGALRAVVATSREIFGADAPSPQREDTPCVPSSPYGAAKLAGHQLVGLLRAHDGLHLSSAILFNHESPRRNPQFLSRKV